MLNAIPDIGLVRDIPKVGSVVRVITRWYNHYVYTAKEQPFVDHVDIGTVLPSERADKSNTFNMTCTGIKMRHRQIPMGYVVSIEYLKGAGIKTSIRAFRVESKSSNKIYLVTVVNNQIECDCLGFKYRRKCKHSDAVRNKIK